MFGIGERPLKFNWTVILASALGIIFIVGVMFSVSFLRQRAERAKLEKQLAAMQTSLSIISPEALEGRETDLKKQLDQSTPQLQQLEAELQPVTGAHASSIVLDTAKRYNLALSDMTSADPYNEQLAGLTFSTISLNIEVTGKTSDILGFVQQLGKVGANLAVKTVQIAVPQSGDNTIASTGDNVTADVELAVYAYQVDK